MRRGALPGAAGLLTFGGLLELLPRIGLVPATYLPPSSRIAQALADEARRPQFWTALGDSLRTWLIGLAVAVAAGLLLGVAIGSVPALRTATASTIEFLRPIPSVALIPLAVLLYGNGIRATLVLVVYAAFWQVLVQVLHGVGDVGPVAPGTPRSAPRCRHERGAWHPQSARTSGRAVRGVVVRERRQYRPLPAAAVAHPGRLPRHLVRPAAARRCRAEPRPARDRLRRRPSRGHRAGSRDRIEPATARLRRTRTGVPARDPAARTASRRHPRRRHLRADESTRHRLLI